MKRVASSVVAVVAIACLASMFSSPALAADAPADRVVAMYFHRTQRCPTCLKMGSYSEEAVNEGFAKEVKQGEVEFHYIDFQDQKNAALTKGYGISSPALVVAKVKGNKVAEFKNLKEIWMKVDEKPDFLEYVRGAVKAYQK